MLVLVLVLVLAEGEWACECGLHQGAQSSDVTNSSPCLCRAGGQVASLKWPLLSASSLPCIVIYSLDSHTHVAQHLEALKFVIKMKFDCNRGCHWTVTDTRGTITSLSPDRLG